MNTFKVSVPVYFIVLGNLLHLKHEHTQGECTSIFYIICVLGNLHHVFVFFYVFFLMICHSATKRFHLLIVILD